MLRRRDGSRSCQETLTTRLSLSARRVASISFINVEPSIQLLRWTGESGEIDVVFCGLRAKDLCALAEIQSDNLAVVRAVIAGAGLGSGHASGGTITIRCPIYTAIGAQILQLQIVYLSSLRCGRSRRTEAIVPLSRRRQPQGDRRPMGGIGRSPTLRSSREDRHSSASASRIVFAVGRGGLSPWIATSLSIRPPADFP